ncbi:hypothetical protein HGRIS_011253 [Hohenbuehelia grisea]|uniref:Uncharacterized protein n=1 Tax=Hohenbuehelia grisea TaxID=104357 RepID=A0ABR3JUH6_9AGAR
MRSCGVRLSYVRIPIRIILNVNVESLTRRFGAVVSNLGTVTTRDAASLADPTSDINAITIDCYNDPEYVLADMTGFYADTSRKLNEPTEIRLLHQAWDINTDKQNWLRSGVDFNNYSFSLGIALLYELFHAPILYQGDILLDVEPGVEDTETVADPDAQTSMASYTLANVQVLSQAEKLHNSQNYVWFAFIAYAKPSMFDEKCPDPENPLTHASKRAVVGAGAGYARSRGAWGLYRHYPLNSRFDILERRRQ